jgi:hypothetical protein
MFGRIITSDESFDDAMLSLSEFPVRSITSLRELKRREDLNDLERADFQICHRIPYPIAWCDIVTSEYYRAR